MSSAISNASPLTSSELGSPSGLPLEEDIEMIENLPHAVTDKLKDMEISPPPPTTTTPLDGEENAEEIEAAAPPNPKPLLLKDILKKTLQKRKRHNKPTWKQ